MMNQVNRNTVSGKCGTGKWLIAGVKLVAGTAAALLAFRGLDAVLAQFSRHLDVCGGIMLVMAIAGFCIYRDTKQSLDEDAAAFNRPPLRIDTAQRHSETRGLQMPASNPHSRRSRAS